MIGTEQRLLNENFSQREPGAGQPGAPANPARAVSRASSERWHGERAREVYACGHRVTAATASAARSAHGSPPVLLRSDRAPRRRDSALPVVHNLTHRDRRGRRAFTEGMHVVALIGALIAAAWAALVFTRAGRPEVSETASEPQSGLPLI
jgi:hypothetical protein